MLDDQKYLTTREAAARIKLGKSTLERMRVEGTGPTFIRATAKRIVYRLADLDAYLAERCRRSTAEPDRAAI
jgi:predicted DNA-binding transcriptional regulator AlpA